jgi:hypothetical protein
MKKGAIQIETIIVIILALLALVIIAAAFTGGFNQLWNKLMGFGSETTIEAARTQCAQWCDTNAKAQYCGYTYTIGGVKQACKDLASCAAITCPQP